MPRKNRHVHTRPRNLKVYQKGKGSNGQIQGRWKGVDRTVKVVLLYKTGECCYYCNTPLDMKTMSVDHKQPRSRGGSDHIDNLCACCRECNEKKADMTEEEFFIVIRACNSREKEDA